MLIYKQKNSEVTAKLAAEEHEKKVNDLTTKLTKVCNNGCFTVKDIQDAYIAFCEYKELTGKDFELNKENTIV